MYSTGFYIIIFRKALFPERLPNLKPKITKRPNSYHKSSMVDSWCMPFPGSDRSVMMRTQRARYHTDNKRPVQISSHVQISSLFWVYVWTILGYIFGILANYKFGRTLLEAFPRFFSYGMISKQVYKNEFYKAKFLQYSVAQCQKIEFWKKSSNPVTRKSFTFTCVLLLFILLMWKKFLQLGLNLGTP